MKNLFTSIILTIALTAGIINCGHNFMGINDAKPKKVLLEAPLYLTPVVQSFWRTVKYWFVGGGGSGIGSKGVPRPPSN